MTVRALLLTLFAAALAGLFPAESRAGPIRDRIREWRQSRGPAVFRSGGCAAGCTALRPDPVWVTPDHAPAPAPQPFYTPTDATGVTRAVFPASRSLRLSSDDCGPCVNGVCPAVRPAVAPVSRPVIVTTPAVLPANRD